MVILDRFDESNDIWMVQNFHRFHLVCHVLQSLLELVLRLIGKAILGNYLHGTLSCSVEDVQQTNSALTALSNVPIDMVLAQNLARNVNSLKVTVVKKLEQANFICQLEEVAIAQDLLASSGNQYVIDDQAIATINLHPSRAVVDRAVDLFSSDDEEVFADAIEQLRTVLGSKQEAGGYTNELC